MILSMWKPFNYLGTIYCKKAWLGDEFVCVKSEYSEVNNVTEKIADP